MKLLLKAAVLGVAVAGLSACGPNPESSAGFTLPKGNAEQGKANYIAFGCHACHSHADVPQLEPAGDIAVKLGGESARVRTYGELVTSVINPSHRVARRSSEAMADESGQSKMATYNDVMTVTQMVDLVAFLQDSYTLSPYQNTTYPVYWYPTDEKK
jgi:L-cysteine S-thiosulfotransferase